MINKNKKFSVRQKLIGSGVILFLGAISITTYASDTNDLIEKNIDNSTVIETDKDVEPKLINIDSDSDIIYKENISEGNSDDKKVEGKITYELKSADEVINQDIEINENEEFKAYVKIDTETGTIESITYTDPSTK